jgi:hypothetical protein
VLTHEALTANALNSIAAFGNDRRRRDPGRGTNVPRRRMNIHTRPALRARATVMLHRRFDAGVALDDIGRVRATLFVAVPGCRSR